jgi:nucleotide-binding universal stress UspA family protein
MIRIAHVLCPVDFSEFSARAVHHASAIAHWYGARLSVLHVFPVMPVLDLPPLLLEDKERHQIMAALRKLTVSVPAATPLDLQVQQAPAIHEAILGQISSTAVDFLVLGSHGRSGVRRLMLGSMTERLIRQAPCPALVVPAHAADIPPDAPVQFHNILCPVDFSDASLRAVEYAISLAEESDARLKILHVINMPSELREFEWSHDELRAQVAEDRRRRLCELVPEGAGTYCTIQTELRDGVVYREILQAAAEQPADLVVMGAQGRGALDVAIFGSNTARVARAVGCPLLVVPHLSKAAHDQRGPRDEHPPRRVRVGSDVR